MCGIQIVSKYWLPPQLDAFEMGGCFTGCKVDTFANMRDLTTMPRSPPISVTLGTPSTTSEGLIRHDVTVNVGASQGGKWLAFFVRLRVRTCMHV